MNKLNKPTKLIILILIPLLVGIVSSLLTKDAMVAFNSFRKPPLSPPGILFPIVWTILYVMMGISSYLIIDNENAGLLKTKKKCIKLYILQLVFNFFWSLIFFGYQLYYLAFIWLIILWVIVLLLILESKKLSKIASCLLIPYMVWMTFAAYLNIGVALMN